MNTTATRLLVLGLLACALLPACSTDGTDGSQGSVGPPGGEGPPGDNGNPGQEPLIEAPGLQLAITAITGGSGGGGRFQAGDTVSVTFTVKGDAGEDLDLAAMDRGSIFVSGPSSNYQRVMARQNDLLGATDNGDGTWTYTFSDPLPPTYLPPLNDSASFGAADGELQGQPLAGGTYTVGMQASKEYTFEHGQERDFDVAVADFLLGGAAAVEHREVVANANCNACHDDLRAHGESYRDVRLCVLCHTAGAEDRNVPSVAGGTPGTTIDFRVMIHKIHNARHLPSVLGVTTKTDGTRDYTSVPVPLEYVGYGDMIEDLSEVGFPVWPNLNVAMPKDTGYSTLPSNDPDLVISGTTLVSNGPLLSPKAREDAIRTGVTACAKCHGDPDGTGPAVAPAQGALAETHPSRQACGACHDDIDWQRTYIANGQTMPSGLSNATCASCHGVSGSDLAVREAHLHPLLDPGLDPGVNTAITAVTGGTGTGGNFQVGDTPTLQFTLKDDAGQDLSLASMDSGATFFYGPSTNRQLVMPFPSTNGMSLNPYDFAGRLQAVSANGKGTMSKVFLGATAAKETLVTEFTSPTDFSVNGTVSGFLGSGQLPGSASTNPSGSSVSALELGPALDTGTVKITFSSEIAFAVTGTLGGASVGGSGSLPNSTSASMRFTSPNLSFNLSVGTTPFAAGNTIHIALFRGSPANPVLFAIVAGRTAFSSAARDRFYYEVVPDGPSYTLRIPMDIALEFLGDSTHAAAQPLNAAGNLPVYYGRQQLWEATTASPLTTTTTTAAVAALAREVAIVPTAGFVNGDTVVIEPSSGIGQREYVQIAPQRADGVVQASASGSPPGDPTGLAVKLYFKTPLRYAHAGAVTITKVTLALRQEGGTSYSIDTSTGVVTAGSTPFASGAGMVMSYRTDARFGYRRHGGDTAQANYVPPANDSTDIGQEQGEWTGLPYQDGTYTADLWLYKNIDLGLRNELQTYRSTSNAGEGDFLYGAATEIVPHAIISTSQNCYTCHNDVIFHGGGRRGLDACLTCHSISGNEDKPRWDTPNEGSAAPATVPTALSPRVAIEFRQMLHKIHKGKELAHADTYTVVGNSGNPSTYGEVGFPAMPGGVRQCVHCHGNDAWHEPADRSHASATTSVRKWTVVCGSCHDSDAAQAHLELQAPGGTESCTLCHGPGADWDVVKAHKTR